RSDDNPLTIDMLSKSLLSCFLYREPVDDNMATQAYKRQSESENMVALMHMLYELGLHACNPKALTGDTSQRQLDRILRSKSMMAWSEILRDAILEKLDLTVADDRVCPFYRELDKRQLDGIRQTVARLLNWKFWSDPREEIDRVLSDNKSVVKEWFR